MEDIRNLYKEYIDICDNVIKYTSDNVKQYINEEFIVGVEYDKIYNKSFKMNLDAYRYNVKLLFSIYLKRCKHFIKQCDKLIYTLKDIKTDESYGMILSHKSKYDIL